MLYKEKWRYKKYEALFLKKYKLVWKRQTVHDTISTENKNKNKNKSTRSCWKISTDWKSHGCALVALKRDQQLGSEVSLIPFKQHQSSCAKKQRCTWQQRWVQKTIRCWPQVLHQALSYNTGQGLNSVQCQWNIFSLTNPTCELDKKNRSLWPSVTIFMESSPWSVRRRQKQRLSSSWQIVHITGCSSNRLLAIEAITCGTLGLNRSCEECRNVSL